ncbi:MAG: LysR family transcriptional regulator [Firmicutes bacterium]|nr:LysR family transcriptional regulator [Bacillota bacterium]
MDIRVLEYFVVAAQEGSITRAAELLHVSQPTISRQLMELESELGRKLFDRSKRSVSLTQDGLLFRESAQEILTLYRKEVAKGAQSTEEPAGDLYLGTGETSSFAYAARKMDQFIRLYPKVHFHVISENGERIFDDIEKGLLDMGLVIRQINPSLFDFHPLPLTERWGILVPKDHPFAGYASIAVNSLRAERLILPENPVFQRELLLMLGPEAEKQVTCYSNLVYNSVTLVKEGVGIAICFENENFPKEDLAFVPFKDYPEPPAFLVWKKRPLKTPLMEKFLDFMIHADSE